MIDLLRLALVGIISGVFSSLIAIGLIDKRSGGRFVLMRMQNFWKPYLTSPISTHVILTHTYVSKT